MHYRLGTFGAVRHLYLPISLQSAWTIKLKDVHSTFVEIEMILNFKHFSPLYLVAKTVDKESLLLSIEPTNEISLAKAVPKVERNNKKNGKWKINKRKDNRTTVLC